MANAEVVAVGMLTHRDLEALGPTFNWAWPVEEAPHFMELLGAIDKADLELKHVQDAEPRHSGH